MTRDVAELHESWRRKNGLQRSDGDRSGFPNRRPLPKGVSQKELNKLKARRAFWHDYCAPGVYLITASVSPDIDCRSFPLSFLPSVNEGSLKSEDPIVPVLSPLGEAIHGELLGIPKFHPELAIRTSVIMPDHIHFLLQVKARLKRMMGRELAGFFGACSKHLMHLNDSNSLITLFSPFHDRIIFNKLQYDRAYAYIEDNPRRLLIKRRYPELFKRRLHLKLGELEYGAYGNIFLLKQPYLLPVRIHRRWSNREMEDYMIFCREAVGQGAVLISPAIHQVEKSILNEAIAGGKGVIKLTSECFGERYKPAGKLFDLCAEGRLLLLAPWQSEGGKKHSGYREFHYMNDMAVEIAGMGANVRMRVVEGLR